MSYWPKILDWPNWFDWPNRLDWPNNLDWPKWLAVMDFFKSCSSTSNVQWWKKQTVFTPFFKWAWQKVKLLSHP